MLADPLLHPVILISSPYNLADADVRPSIVLRPPHCLLILTSLFQRVCARVADFQFKPSVYDDDTSTDGGERNRDEPFPLKKWQDALGESRLAAQMYFL